MLPLTRCRHSCCDQKRLHQGEASNNIATITDMQVGVGRVVQHMGLQPRLLPACLAQKGSQHRRELDSFDPWHQHPSRACHRLLNALLYTLEGRTIGHACAIKFGQTDVSSWTGDPPALLEQGYPVRGIHQPYQKACVDVVEGL